jgi:hypothetical protein
MTTGEIQHIEIKTSGKLRTASHLPPRQLLQPLLQLRPFPGAIDSVQPDERRSRLEEHRAVRRPFVVPLVRESSAEFGVEDCQAFGEVEGRR